MTKYSFKNDYAEGCHPKILESLMNSNSSQREGYGEDEYCFQAKRYIQKHLESTENSIYFLSWGTQANLTFISAVLRPHESVIAVTSWHIAIHEAGAIESTGHKVCTVPGLNGKIYPKDIQSVLDTHTDLHMVKPRMVYISQSTEIGTIYTKSELEAISDCCKTNNLYLFMDGARIWSALCADWSDLTLPIIANLVDAFYIGGTKNGALFGEALIIINPLLDIDFWYSVKQKWALLAKWSILGIQFLELFRDNLFFDLAHHANTMAMKLVAWFQEWNYLFLTDSSTNQIFPILPNSLIDTLAEKYDFYIWEKVDTNNSAIRLVTSWATLEEQIDSFVHDLRINK